MELKNSVIKYFSKQTERKSSSQESGNSQQKQRLPLYKAQNKVFQNLVLRQYKSNQQSQASSPKQSIGTTHQRVLSQDEFTKLTDNPFNKQATGETHRKSITNRTQVNSNMKYYVRPLTNRKIQINPPQFLSSEETQLKYSVPSTPQRSQKSQNTQIKSLDRLLTLKPVSVQAERKRSRDFYSQVSQNEPFQSDVSIIANQTITPLGLLTQDLKKSKNEEILDQLLSLGQKPPQIYQKKTFTHNECIKRTLEQIWQKKVKGSHNKINTIGVKFPS